MQEEDLKKVLLEIVTKQVNNIINRDILLEDEMAKIGLNSIAFIQIIVELEEKLEFEFDDDSLDFYKFHTIQDIFMYIKGKLNV